MEKLKEIQAWLDNSCKNDTLFISIRFKTPPKTKIALSRRCKPIFRLLFKSELGRHWYKLYSKYFFLIGLKELGKYKNLHAHFILGLKQDINIELIIYKLKKISVSLGFDIWESDIDKLSNQKSFGNDIMVKKVYSSAVYAYILKEVLIINNKITNDPFILGEDIFT